MGAKQRVGNIRHLSRSKKPISACRWVSRNRVMATHCADYLELSQSPLRRLGGYTAATSHAHQRYGDRTFNPTFEVKSLRPGVYHGRNGGQRWSTTSVVVGGLSPQRTEHPVCVQRLNHGTIDLHISPIGGVGQGPNLGAILNDPKITKSEVLDKHKWADVESGSDDH